MPFVKRTLAEKRKARRKRQVVKKSEKIPLRSARRASRQKKRVTKKTQVERKTTAVAKTPRKPVRIGILLTYPKLEVKKEEMITYKKNRPDELRPWTKEASPDHIVERKFRREKPVKRHPLGKYAIPTDVSVGCYIKHTYQNRNVEVDFILPHEISTERLKANDLNFLLIYDLLESFHTDKTKDKRIYNTLKQCLKEAGNIYPPLEYQELIYSKINYYNYLKKHNINIAPTLTMTAEEYQELGHEAAMRKVVEHIQGEKWDRFIAKPVYGMEGIDAQFFHPKQKKGLEKYFNRCMSKYPGIVVQKEIPDFGNSTKCPEIRMYFVGQRYQYSVSAMENTVKVPECEGGNFKAPMEALKKSVRTILNKLPPIVMPNGIGLPRLLTRLDMGYIMDGKYKPFVNEVEFVPSLYTEDVPKMLIDKKLGDQMVRIAREYVACARELGFDQ